MIVKRTLLSTRVLIACCVLACAAGRSIADQQALSGWTGGSDIYATFDLTAGWRFSLSEPVLVTMLGMYDTGSDGLVESHNVAIWDDSGSNILAQVTVPSNFMPGQDWYWEALPGGPVLLSPGTYVIGVYVSNGSPDGAIYAATSVTTDPRVTYLENRITAGWGYPWHNAGLDEKSYFGPNFRFDPVPVPEPSLIQLPALLGMAGMGLWWRRKTIA